MNLKDKAVLFGALGLVPVFMAIDGYGDWLEGDSIWLIMLDQVVSVGALVVLGSAGYYFLSRWRTRMMLTQRQSDSFRTDAEYWKREASQLLQGLSQAIDHQFERWGLTKSEKEVALLLLKGFSMEEAAAVRGVSAKTIRHQSLAVYQKGGLKGRADLAGFFLEDLLVPNGSPTGPEAPARLEARLEATAPLRNIAPTRT